MESAAERAGSRVGGGAGPSPLRRRLLAYYRRPAVRARLLEFLGGESLEEATAQFVTTAPVTAESPLLPLPPAACWQALERDLELSRSLADRHGLLAHVDLEHVHFDRPWESYTQSARAFALQQPVELAIERLLVRHGVDALHVVTGRGHHGYGALAARRMPALLRARAVPALAPLASRCGTDALWAQA